MTKRVESVPVRLLHMTPAAAGSKAPSVLSSCGSPRSCWPPGSVPFVSPTPLDRITPGAIGPLPSSSKPARRAHVSGGSAQSRNSIGATPQRAARPRCPRRGCSYSRGAIATTVQGRWRASNRAAGLVRGQDGVRGSGSARQRPFRQGGLPRPAELRSSANGRLFPDRCPGRHRRDACSWRWPRRGRHPE
jgi:hypothetical protein